MDFLLVILSIVCLLLESKETPIYIDDYQDQNAVDPKCCSETTNDCCVTLEWGKSISKNQDVPEQFGGQYYCENMSIKKTPECGQLDYFLLPLSSACDLTRVIWDLRWISYKTEANGFIKAVINKDGSIDINNCDELLLSKNDADNPTEFDVLRIPIPNEPWNNYTQIISVCTQLESGNIVDNINQQDIQIGFGLNNGDRFKCTNDTVRDLCSIDVNLAELYSVDYGSLSPPNSGQPGVHVKNIDHNNVDNDWFTTFAIHFEYYWNEFIGYGVAIFAASILFNMVMCAYYSGYKGNNNIKMNKYIETDDDTTDEESEDSDDYSNNRDVLSDTYSDDKPVVINRM